MTGLAEALADGTPIDWAEAGRALVSDEEREALAAYRRLALVGKLFATASTSLGATPKTRAELAPGNRWGNLRIEAYVGQGRFGDVYRAWDPALGRTVALKLIASDSSAESDDALVREGSLMARVRHPNVVAIHGAQRIGALTGLTMEFVEGRTLEAELVERGPFDVEELTRVAVDLCGALAAVHKAGLVHRDVKATNVIREPSGRIVLGDFGTGLSVDGDERSAIGLVGTPVYIAPEIFQRGAATAQSDLYSLGVLLFHLVTARFPVTGRSISEMRAAHRAGGRSSLATLRPDLSTGICAAIDRLLDPDPARRFPDAERALSAIQPSNRSPRRHFVAAAALVAVGITGLTLWRSSPTAPASSVSGPGVVHPRPEMQATLTFRGPALNGQVIACQDDVLGNAAICNLATGGVRVLRPSAPGSFAPAGRSMLLSPDGSRVAYQWISSPRGSSRVTTVNVIDSGGQRNRELYRSTTGAALMHRWLADGSALLVSEPLGDEQRAFLLPVDGGAQTEVARLGKQYGQFLDLSPDGRHLAVTVEAAPADFDLVVIDLATKQSTAGIAGPFNVEYPLWTPDGRSIVFITTREGGSTLMRQAMNGGAATGSPEVVWRFGRSDVRPIAFGADGALFAMHKAATRTAYVSSIDLSRGVVGPARLLEPADAEDSIGADWSPDGQRVAYLRGKLGRGPRGPKGMVVIRMAGGGIVGEIPLPNWLPQSATQVRWSADGRHLAVAYGGNGPDHMTIDVIDTETQGRRTVVSGTAFAYPRWDPAGEWLYLQEDDRIIRHHLATSTVEPAYSAEGLGIQRNGGFDFSRVDGALAILATDPKKPGCLIRVVDRSRTIADRHRFEEDCRAVAWSHDGSKLLVSTVPWRGNPSLWSLDRVGGDPVRLPIEAPIFHDLSISPRGDQLLFTSGNPTFTMVMVTGVKGG